MFRLTLAQMRTSAGRLVAAGIAIALGACFIAVTFLATTVMEKTVLNSLATGYGKADLVVSVDTDNPLSDNRHLFAEDLNTVEAVDGVADAAAVDGAWAVITGRDQAQSWIQIQVMPKSETLVPIPVKDGGRLPTGSSEVAIPATVADRLKLKVGDKVDLSPPDFLEGTELTDEEALAVKDIKPEQVTVVGLLDDSNLSLGGSGRMIASQDSMAAFYELNASSTAIAQRVDCRVESESLVDAGDQPEDQREESPSNCQDLASTVPEPIALDHLVVKVSDLKQVIAIQGKLADALPGLSVLTVDEVAAKRAAEFTGDSTMITAMMLGFAGVALFVAGLVITNTFQVIVAQRTRTLALLRCVGATRSQIRQSVLTEAAILGSISSVIGLISGLILGQGTLWVLAAKKVSQFIPSAIAVTPTVIIIPIVVGVIVTMLAALSPARQSTRVPALAALRPIAMAPQGKKGVVRKVISILLVVFGLVVLVGGIALTTSSGHAGEGVLFGLFGGMVSFTGILLAAVYFVPATIRLLSKPLARIGVVTKLATENTVRNPHRTAATSTALIIGVTLVTLISVGATSAKATLDTAYTQRYPFDVQVQAPLGEDGPGALSSRTQDAVKNSPGIVASMSVSILNDVEVSQPGDDDPFWVNVYGIDPAQASETLTDPSLIEDLKPGTVLVSHQSRFADSPTLTLNLDSQGSKRSATFKVVTSKLSAEPVFIVPSDFETLAGTSTPNAMWIKIDPAADGEETVEAITQAVVDESKNGGTTGLVTGTIVERQEINKVIDTVLLVVIGLLAVAVLIALIGVANTLSLSVIERRRESAMLRALGMTRRALRGSLAVEGAIIAGIGALLGVVLGILYGVAGAATVLAAINNGGAVSYMIPWGQVVIVIVVAIIAGLIASVAPANRAAKTPPVAALAED